MGTTQFQGVPGPSGNGISLNTNDFRTEAVKNSFYLGYETIQ